jgi:L-lactate dehydrogenase complex protein LldG
MSDAREEILSAMRARRVRSAPRPAPYRVPASRADAVLEFMQRAQGAGAEVRRISRMTDVPEAVAAALRDRNAPAVVHLPPDANVASLPWPAAPGLTLKHEAPGRDDAALAVAPYGVSETGTLVYPSDAARPASWHFRAGLEIAVLRAAAILPSFESVIARVKHDGALPHTLNFVTGPSRTGDIEQTLELGAHGPKALVVLIVEDSD